MSITFVGSETASWLDIQVASGGDSVYEHLCTSWIRGGLRKVFSSHRNGLSSECIPEELTPRVETFFLAEGLSIILVCPFYSGVEIFFHSMISRSIFPGSDLEFSQFFHSHFSFVADIDRLFSFCELRFLCQSREEQEKLAEQFLEIREDLVLGAQSLYQGRKVLEGKGRSSLDKQALIYERATQLIHRRPEDFDFDVFEVMRYFLASCREDFIQNHEPRHLDRLVLVSYLIKKHLRRQVENEPHKRHVSFKLSRVRLYSPFGLRYVLGVFVGVSFTHAHEVFEESHLLKALKNYVPNLKKVEGSSFLYGKKEEKSLVLYVEIEKEEGEVFTAVEISQLQEQMPLDLSKQVEKLRPSVFMPRNEEEVMKNILVLSQQLRYVKDLPQLFISFEGQIDEELLFTVILARVLLPKAIDSLKELFLGKTRRGFVFIEDRVKIMGALRNKYPKEITVFQVRVNLTQEFLRKDHSVDLFLARQAIVQEVQEKLGSIRDYNGGMISHQMNNLLAFKQLFPNMTVQEELEIEHFFHHIFPIEMRSVVYPIWLQILYNLYKKGSWEQVQIYQEPGCIILFKGKVSGSDKDRYDGYSKTLSLRSSQVLYFCKEEGGSEYGIGYIFQGLLPEQEGKILAYFI